MRLSSIRIQNFRSIVDTNEIRIGNFQAFVGENNSGKSNILRAIEVFLSSGAGGVQESSFFDKTQPIVITAKFSELTDEERKALRIYLIGNELILEKQLLLQADSDAGKTKLIDVHKNRLR